MHFLVFDLEVVTHYILGRREWLVLVQQMWEFPPYAPLLNWLAFMAEKSSSFVGTLFDDRIEDHPISCLSLMVLVYQTQEFGVPQVGCCGIP